MITINDVMKIIKNLKREDTILQKKKYLNRAFHNGYSSALKDLKSKLKQLEKKG